MNNAYDKNSPIDNRSSISSSFRHRFETDESQKHMGERSETPDYGLAAKLYLQEQAAQIKENTSVKTFMKMLWLSLVLIITMLVVIGILCTSGSGWLSGMCFIFIVELMLNLLATAGALYMKVGDSTIKLSMMYKIIKFVILGNMILLIATLACGVINTMWVTSSRYYGILILEILEDVRLIILFHISRQLFAYQQELNLAKSQSSAMFSVSV